MDRIERVLSYVLLVLFILLMVLSTLISFDLSTSLFHPINFAQEVLWYVPTAIFFNTLMIVILNSLILLIGHIVAKYPNKE